MSKQKIIMNEITPDEFVRLLDYSVNRVIEDGDRTTVEFFKQIDTAIICREVMFEGDCIYMSQEYLVDVLPEKE